MLKQNHMKISELIGLTNELIRNSKIHFAIGVKERFEPLYSFYRNDFKEWQEHQNKKNFERDYILSLIYFGKDEWLFAGFYKRITVAQNDYRFKYETELLNIGVDLIGRLVIKFTKTFRQSYPYLENYIRDFELLEILREKYTVEPFPGFEKINIKFELLRSIIAQEEKSWKTALSIVKGVYLIADLSNGKLYVGSAYNEYSFWTRWSEYSNNGHGGNVLLKSLIDKNGVDYAKNFQFSILESRSMNAESDAVIKRESFWKDILLSREFGYNKN